MYDCRCAPVVEGIYAYPLSLKSRFESERGHTRAGTAVLYANGCQRAILLAAGKRPF